MDQTQTQSIQNVESLLRERRRREFSKSYSAAPFMVYRSAKYSGLRARAFGHMTNARAYLKHPILQKWVSRLLSLLYDVAAGLLFIASFPVLLVSFCAMQLFRKLQICLVKKYYPTGIICDDFSARNSPSSSIASDIVTSLIWVKGNLDLDAIRCGLDSRISSPSSPLLLLCRVLVSRFRVLMWEDPSNSQDFKIEDHITLAPSKFYETIITDEPLSGASVLQKYVTFITSSPLPSCPWAITLIPLPTRTLAGTSDGKSNTYTLVILRFHRHLLREKAVISMFLSSLGQKGTFQVDLREAEDEHISQSQLFLPCEFGGQNMKMNEVGGEDSEPGKCLTDKSRIFWKSFIQSMESFILDFDGWITLRQRQAEFHSPLALGKLMLYELSENVAFKSAQLSNGFNILKQLSLNFLKVLRAIFYSPKILLKICFTNRSLSRVGLYPKCGESSKSVSWSRQLSTQFLQEICSKMESSHAESVVLLAAVSLALKDYYQENCIQNPINLGASIFESSSPNGRKLVELPTRICDISKELNNLEEQVHSFSDWKQLALYYLIKASSLILPQWVAYHLVVQKLSNRYPFHITIVDTHSSFPHLTFWGHPVTEFTSIHHFFPGMSITLIKYGGTFRLSMSSPMKSVDSFITQRFPQYLNKIAEVVGLDRRRIPYTRKSSPLSSNASSPDGTGDGSVFIPNVTKSSCSSLSGRILIQPKPIKRFNSCQNLKY